MILPPFRRNRRPDTISVLYGAIVAQARRPVFYREYAVPDTLDGRFDLLLLHLVLVLRRIRAIEDGSALSQQLFDHFCSDMDHNLREAGTGDLAVPKRMRAIGEAFYGRFQAYEEGLENGRLTPVLIRNVYGGRDVAQAGRLATYIEATARHLAALDGDWFGRGNVSFPDPADMAGPKAAVRAT
jgi:cytochrome b pre-mRNA-processing protein 3